ncbi:hypothetical protein BC830DRAFT_1147393 [Chytriomyces sp. MP71]|nr:hypothetical protein BC830DRAFT_1147393 [Chytriomyces sp. MP71]
MSIAAVALLLISVTSSFVRYVPFVFHTPIRTVHPSVNARFQTLPFAKGSPAPLFFHRAPGERSPEMYLIGAETVQSLRPALNHFAG